MISGDVTATSFQLLVLLHTSHLNYFFALKKVSIFLFPDFSFPRLTLVFGRMFRSVLWTVGNMVRDAGLSLDRVGLAIQGRQAFRESRMSERLPFPDRSLT